MSKATAGRPRAQHPQAGPNSKPAHDGAPSALAEAARRGLEELIADPAGFVSCVIISEDADKNRHVRSVPDTAATAQGLAGVDLFKSTKTKPTRRY